ncbi:MAG: DUF4157 domain-containing protein [Oceanospirillaceae bacterium]
MQAPTSKQKTASQTPVKPTPGSSFKRARKSGTQVNKANRVQPKNEENAVSRKSSQPAYLQKKLQLGQANDPLEAQADKVADEVTAMPISAGNELSNTAQRSSLAPEDLREQPQSLQAKRATSIGNANALGSVNDISSANEASSINDDIANKIAAKQGLGAALSNTLLDELANKMSYDFSHVNIHTDSESAFLCNALNARAFTLGSDVFFNTGEFAPLSVDGKKLLIHELTHVVQQNNQTIHTKVMRDEIAKPASYTNDDGMIDTAAKKIQIKGLRVPTFKHAFYSAAQFSTEADGLLTWRRNASTGGSERNTTQIPTWESDVREQADAKVVEKLAGAQRTEQAGKFIYYLKYNSGKSYLFGTQRTIQERCRRPIWRGDGTPAAFQVDHQVEHQTGGRDVIDNMWLLDGSINGQSGRDIRSQIRTKVAGFVSHIQDKVDSPPADIDTARSQYVVYFDPIRGRLGSYRAVNQKQQYYSREHIKAGAHLDGLEPMSQAAIDASGLMTGDAANIHIFPSASGGFHYSLEKPEGADDYQLSTQSIRGQRSKNFDINRVDFDAQTKQGSIHIKMPSEALAQRLPTTVNPVNIEPIDIVPMDGITWGGKFDINSLKRQVINAMTTFQGLSPLTIDEVAITDSGLTITGVIDPTLPLIEDSSINFSLSGEEISIYKEFSATEIKVPPPFNIGSSSLLIGINNSGLFIDGLLSFSIDKIGNGFLAAEGQAGFDDSSAIALSGEFDFDKRIFGEGNSAQVRMGYADGQWSMGGTLSIGEDQIKGIRSATIEVEYSEADGFSAIGEAQLSVPGVESGRLEITQSEESGFEIKGAFALSSQTPGIRGGAITASLIEKADGSGFAIAASGEAQPDIPGLNSNLLVSYDDGTFTAQVNADYARGMLSGAIEAGVTNRSVTQDGALSERAEEGNPLIVYGGGELTLQIAPWLQGKAGVKFAPNGEITVSGEIGLPDQLEIFSRKQLDKSIFNIAVQAPIFPGVVAEIGGGLSAQAGIGPGVIDQLRLGIVYNPAREEETTITGEAHLNIPTDAGLRLSVRAGIGLGIPGASVTGGLDIGGTLGIAGAAEAAVNVNWTPTAGLDLTASVAVSAQPSFTFDIGGYVDVRALGMSVYDNRWQFASYTFGSDYRFGIKLPVHYHEGEPFSVSLSDVEFEVPDINTDQLMKGLIARIA